MRGSTARNPKRTEADSPMSVRLEESLREALRSQARRTGKPISRVINELLEMAVRMQRFPGIIFLEGPAGRRAHLAGTGLDVWEIVELLNEYKASSRLREAFPSLSPRTIQVAEAYAKTYPAEIEAFLELNAREPKYLKQELPWLEVERP